MNPTVLSVAYPLALVDADPVGGAEQVLAGLDRALVAAGWRSIVVATQGSTPEGELVPVPRTERQIDEASRARVQAAVRDAIAGVLARGQVDLIHLHGVDFAHYLPPHDPRTGGPPVLATLHLPLAWYEDAALQPSRPDTHLMPVSAAQAATAPPGVVLLDPIANGVDVEGWPRLTRRGYLLCLGRICPEKGFHLALDAAHALDMPLLLAGEVFPYAAHQAYFAQQIAPRLDRRRRWIGPVRGARKRRLLAAAAVVVVPSLVPETSSLVAREAAAAGTPVAAFDVGAMSETVEDGVTGVLVPVGGDLAPAVVQARSMDPQACRDRARARFALPRMTQEYLDLYRRLIAADAVRSAA